MTTANPALVDHWESLLQPMQQAGVFIPGSANLKYRRAHTVLFHRVAITQAGLPVGESQPVFRFFNAAGKSVLTNVARNRLDRTQLFRIYSPYVDIVPGVDPSTGAAIAAAGPTHNAVDTANTVPPPLAVADAVNRMLKVGQFKLRINNDDYSEGMAGLDHFPKGGGLAGVFAASADGHTASRNLTAAFPRNGDSDLSNRWPWSMLIPGDTPFEVEIAFPAAITLGTGTATDVRGYIEFGFRGDLYTRVG